MLFFFDQKAYLTLKFSSINVSQLLAYGYVLADILNPYFKGLANKGNGRYFISELFAALASLTREEYLALHIGLVEGPFHACFNWAIRKTSQGSGGISYQNVSEKKFSGDHKYYCRSVKQEFIKCFEDCSQTATGQAWLKQDVTGAILPVWVGALPTMVEMPKSRDMASTASYMALCRTHRQTDEKGLSAWSSGYGATGNPTKPQLRMQKKLSIVLGLLLRMSSKEKLIIFDDLVNELPVFHGQLLAWKDHVPALSSKQWKYVVPTSATQIIKFLEGYSTTSTTWNGDNLHLLYFPNLAITYPKASDWQKADLAQKDALHSMLGSNFNPKQRGGTQVHVYTGLYSADVFNWFSVYTLGSAHNMMALLTTSPDFHFAACSGQPVNFLDASSTSSSTLVVSSDPSWNVVLERGQGLTVVEFCTRVIKHNAARCAFFLNGEYHFNPKLNLLRHIEGKVMNFVLGELDDIKGFAYRSHIDEDFAGAFDDEEETDDEGDGNDVDDGPDDFVPVDADDGTGGSDDADNVPHDPPPEKPSKKKESGAAMKKCADF